MEYTELFKLVGIVIVIVGFMLKLDTLATVIIAGIATAIVSGMTVQEIFSNLGTAFLNNRLATIFVLTLPIIGSLERYGLKDKAVDLIKKFKAATAGKVIFLYELIRTPASALSLRIGGHAQFVRPLINPMAQAAAVAKYGEIPETQEEEIKAAACAVENYGNFFAQNCFLASSGTLLIVSTLTEQGFNQVTAAGIASWSVPVAVISVVMGYFFTLFLDRKINRGISQQDIKKINS